jgi:hypothetical protein
MTSNLENQELKERLELIEGMLTEGRRRTESWGWVFVLWGVAYYVAALWSTWGHGVAAFGRNGLAWPVTMLAAVALTLGIGFRKGKGRPGTTVSRAIASVWNAMGIAMLPLFLALSLAGRMDEHSFVAILAAMLGIANGASGMILKWKMQIGCAVVWWTASVVACFGSRSQLAVVFFAAIFLCQIVFGIYAMINESRRRVQGAAHA